jgi:hypothetical protein
MGDYVDGLETTINNLLHDFLGDTLSKIIQNESISDCALHLE